MGVAGFVDHSHPTFIQFLENLIPSIVLPSMISLIAIDEPGNNDGGILRGARGEVKLAYYALPADVLHRRPPKSASGNLADKER